MGCVMVCQRMLHYPMMFLEHDFAISVVDAFAASAATVAHDDNTVKDK